MANVIVGDTVQNSFLKDIRNLAQVYCLGHGQEVSDKIIELLNLISPVIKENEKLDPIVIEK